MPPPSITGDDAKKRGQKRSHMMRELEELQKDKAGKGERDRLALWRKIQKYLSRNDDIANEYGCITLIHIVLILHRVCQFSIIVNDYDVPHKHSFHL